MKQSGFEQDFIGFDEAFRLAIGNVPLCPEEACPTHRALFRIASRPIKAKVDSPSADSSIKDGYAVQSFDVATATISSPIELKLVGALGAGESPKMAVVPGTALRILSGAVIPNGADAVVTEEFTYSNGAIVKVFADAHPGRNILVRGTDVKAGEIIVGSGERITPAKVAVLVAGGVNEVWVFCAPRVGLLATGDEVLLPGKPIKEGGLYASNIALQEAWLKSFGLSCLIGACGDSSQQLVSEIESTLGHVDTMITSGGAWNGDRDIVVKTLRQIGWRPLFNRVRMGPGKAVGMGTLKGKPVFCLPGGPPSNEMAFFMIVLPSILRMYGYTRPPFPEFYGRLTHKISGQSDWTQFVHCRVSRQNFEFYLTPLDMSRRLSAMGLTEAIVKIPEGVEILEAQALVPFTMLDAGNI